MGVFMPRPFANNARVPNERIRTTELSPEQKDKLLQLSEVYIGRLRAGHSEVWLGAVRQHLDDTYFMWMGGVDQSTAFYRASRFSLRLASGWEVTRSRR